MDAKDGRPIHEREVVNGTAILKHPPRRDKIMGNRQFSTCKVTIGEHLLIWRSNQQKERWGSGVKRIHPRKQNLSLTANCRSVITPSILSERKGNPKPQLPLGNRRFF
jgi:hypothetical protein